MGKLTCLAILSTLFHSSVAQPFCGFFVSRAGTDLFNQASKVVMVRDENKTVLTLSNDYQGELKEFAIVTPVPEVLEKYQIHVANNNIIDHLDKYTAPRLVEYNDRNPCEPVYLEKAFSSGAGTRRMLSKSKSRSKKLGVTIEAEYTIGEYDIIILSAKESSGLITWLKENKYKLPHGAEDVVGSYLKKGMKFFLAKVNLKEQNKLGFKFLRPLQMAYSSNKFMLPIRLGMLNAKKTQDLFVFALTRKGRVETTNYRTKKLPSNLELPTYIKDEFSTFYKDMFSHQVQEDQMKSVWLEYAWDMNWCDPCAADPLKNSELKELGVFWLKDDRKEKNQKRRILPSPPFPGKQKNVFVTRLHLRYNANNFPDDLQFQVTSDRQNFQGRYILRNKWTGSDQCEMATRYRKELPKQVAKEAQNLHDITGWDLKKIHAKLEFKPAKENNKDKWWKKLWN